MLKKALILAALLTIGATGLMAADHWVGTFWGDASGDWKGTINDQVDPPVFEGTWTDGHQTGTLYAVGDIVDGYYVFEKGESYNEAGELVGNWSGKFPIYSDAYVTGPWWSVDGTQQGKWGGYRP